MWQKCVTQKVFNTACQAHDNMVEKYWQSNSTRYDLSIFRADKVVKLHQRLKLLYPATFFILDVCMGAL